MPRRLSARLEAVAKLIPDGAYLADIGSDHAFLPIALVQRGKISYAQAVDNKMGPFLRMKANVEDAGLESRITLTNADGLDELVDGANCLSICGVGGLLTCQILEKHPEKLVNIRTIVCDPHKDLVAVRKRVSALGYHIAEETMVYENKIYYAIIRFDKGERARPYDAMDLYFGPIARKERSQVYLDWIEENRKIVSSHLKKNLPPEKREHYLKLYRALAKQLKGNEGN